MLRTFATVFLCGSFSAIAQNNDTTSTNDLQEEIKIFKNYIPEISRVNKKNQQPLFLDSVYIKENLQYQVKKIVLKVDENNHLLNTIDYKKPLKDELSSYALFGYATDKRPMGEISLSNKISEKSKYGIFVRHYSENRNDDKIHYQDRSENEAMAYFDFMDEGITFKSNIGYKRFQLNSDLVDTISFIPPGADFTVIPEGNEMKNDTRNHQLISGDFSIEQNGPKKLVQKVNFNIKHGFNNFDASETYVDFGSKWNIPLKKHNIIANLDFITVDHEAETKSKDGRLSHFQFDPTFYGQEGKFSFQLGINGYLLIHEMNETTSDLLLNVNNSDDNYKVYPKIHASYQLNENTNIQVGFKGEYGIYTFVEALAFTPFISPSLNALPVPSSYSIPTNTYLGISTKLLSNLDINVNLSYKKYDRFQNYVKSLGVGFKDHQLYIHPYYIDLKVMTLNIEANYKLDSKTTILGKLEYNKYEDYPSGLNLSHLPDLKMNIDGKYIFDEKLSAFAGVQFVSSHYSLNQVDKIDAYADLSVGTSYDLTNRFSMSLQIRNLLNNEIETNQGYISNGFNLLLSTRVKF